MSNNENEFCDLRHTYFRRSEGVFALYHPGYSCWSIESWQVAAGRRNMGIEVYLLRP